VASYVLIHGAGGDSWYWHLVGPQLAELGHDVVAVDLPCDDDRSGLSEYADCVVDAAAGAGDGARGEAGMVAPEGT
jgi:pimeloyl-ACP methyl ester carboxylesterase